MNPLFTKHILKLLGLSEKLIYEEDLINAYEERLSHFNQENVRYDMADHG